MTMKYYAILTNQGAARLANATMLGSKLNLTQMAVGDANGVLPTPNPAQTKLINQKRIAPLNLLSVDPNNQSQIIAEQIIPEDEGGFWIREIGLYDDKGVLIAVANCPETYKPQLQEGSGRTQTIRMILVVTNTKAITLKIDPSVVLATRKYVDDKISKHEQSRRHPDASLTAKGFVQLSSATDSQSETEAATPKAVKIAYDLARGKYTAQDATTTRKGIVQLSSAINSTSEILAATPKAVKAAYDLANGKQPADATLTALAGLVTAADRLPYFTGADRAALATLTAIGRAIIAKGSIKDVLNYLGLGEAAKRNVGTGTNQIPDMGSFTLSVSGTGYQKLPSGFILQWGSIGAPSIAQDVVTHFPIAFPNRCLRVLVSQDYTPDSGAVGYIACAGFSSDPVKFISRASTPGLGASFLALGC